MDSDAYVGEIRLMAFGFAPDGWVICNGQSLAIGQYAALFALIGTTYGGDGKSNFCVPDLRGRVPVGVGVGVTVDATGNNQSLSQITLGQKRGQESIVLNANQLPAHSHPFTATTGSQNITIPGTTGKNTKLSGTVGVVPAQGDTGNDFTPVAGQTYRLAGANVVGPNSLAGPYSNSALPTPSAYVSGVSVDASGMTPNIPPQTVPVTTVTGGRVELNTPVGTAVPTIPPQLGLNWCIAVTGIFPVRS